jgi:hypothetical protein
MKQTILAARRQEAHDRLVREAQRLAAVLGLPDPVGLEPHGRNPTVRQLRRDEFLGSFLAQVRVAMLDGPTAVTQLDPAEGYLSESDILAIPGLNAAGKRAVTTHFERLRETAVKETTPDNAPAD